jgi:YVTN family beta-propeller protein
MNPLRFHGPRASHALACALAGLILLSVVPISSATGAATFRATIGTNGANGTATLTAASPGSASLALSLRGLARATTYAASLNRGSCAKPSSRLFSLASFRSTSGGRVTRTSAVTAAQMLLLSKAPATIRIVAGRQVFCGAFPTISIQPPVTPPPTSPPPTPVPTPVTPLVASVAATVTTTFLPLDVAVTPAAIWVANGDNTVSKMDPTTNAVVLSLKVGPIGAAFPNAIAIGDDGDLWIASSMVDSSGAEIAGSVVRLDGASGQIKATIPVGPYPSDLTAGAGSIWVVNAGAMSVMRIDQATNIATMIDLTVPHLTGIGFGEGSIWVSATDGAVLRIDPVTNRVMAMIATAGGANGIVALNGAIWIACSGHKGQADGSVARIDPATNQVTTTIPVGSGPFYLATAGGYVWVSLFGEPSVVAINPLTNAVETRVSTQGVNYGIAGGDHAVWVAQPNIEGVSATPPQPGTVTRISF